MGLGPYGIGHLAGKAVMVPHAAPGDLVEVEIATETRDYAMARLQRVVRPGPDRRQAPCPYLPRCGGCGWQHLNYAAQLRLKGEIVARELRRALNYDTDAAHLVEPSPGEFGYRSRIRLCVGPAGELGFREPGGRGLVPIDRCLVADPALQMPRELARLIGRRCREIEVVVDDDGVAAVVYLALCDPDQLLRLVEREAAELRRHGLRGVVLRAGVRRAVWGNTTVKFEVEPGLSLDLEADLFSQVNRQQNRKLVGAVMTLADVTPGISLFDLFCGAGNLSLPAARRGACVLGADVDAQAIEAATRNAQRLGLAETQFVTLKAAEMTDFLARAGYRPTVVVLDPPRGGAARLVEPLARLCAPRLVYVSCNLATLMRDLRGLAAAGYRLEQVRAFDFFPNTHHVELVASLVLTSNARRS